MHVWQRAGSVCLLMLAMMVSGGASAASSVLIWPTDPTLEADQQASAVWLENRGDRPVSLQVRVFFWVQEAFDDQYQNQHDVIGIPQVARIEPGQKQLVRLTRLGQTPAGTQQAYRIIIDEMPSSAADGAEQGGSAVRFNMRYVIPLFAYGTGLSGKHDPARPAAVGSLARPELAARQVQHDGLHYIELHNSGRLHARLTEVRIDDGKKPQVLFEGLMGYVLPGATMRWPIPAAVPRGQELVMRINGETKAQRFSLD